MVETVTTAAVFRCSDFRLLRLWLATAVRTDAQGVVVAVAGCLDGVSAGVSVRERDDLDHFSAVIFDGFGAAEQTTLDQVPELMRVPRAVPGAYWRPDVNAG